jgi:hypothetical protein
MTNGRAARYRRLALAERDPENARLLQLIADESERGVKVTADWMTQYMGEPPKKADGRYLPSLWPSF